jgi:serine/threonine protein kinase
MWSVYDTKFKLENRYEIIDALGSGAYGTVVAAEDLKHKEGRPNIVAIKKIERAFEHPLFTKRTLRELRILRLLSHENVIDLLTIQKPLVDERLDIYAVFEIMETDLGSIVKSTQDLSMEHIQFFLYQILRGMKYVHSAGILHRDLKPRNLLVNGNCDLKICDFGLSRANIPEMMKAGAMTDYISTRWYRAPELLCGAEIYTEAVDMWSIGCIFAELLLRHPFLPGDDTENQLELIVNCFGQPEARYLQSFNDGRMLNIFQEMENQNEEGHFNDTFANCDPVAVDLLKKMLLYDPEERITIEDALKHEFIGDLHYAPDEPTTVPVSAFDFDFEMYDLTIEEQKEIILDEIALYHSKKAQKKYVKHKKKYPMGMLHLKYGSWDGYNVQQKTEETQQEDKPQVEQESRAEENGESGNNKEDEAKEKIGEGQIESKETS